MSNKKKANRHGHSMSEVDKMFARIKSRFLNRLSIDQMSPAKLKKLNEMWQGRKPKRWDDFTKEEQKALAKEQAQLQREGKRDEEWDSIRKFLQRGIDIKSDDPNSELFRTAKELLDIVDRAQKEPLSVSKYEQQKFCTGLDRYKVLLKAELNRQLKEKPVKRTIVAILISLILIVLFGLFVHLGPVTWFRNHAHTYGIQGSIICLIPCLIFGFLKPRWRKWCWGTAAIALLVGLLSLL